MATYVVQLLTGIEKWLLTNKCICSMSENILISVAVYLAVGKWMAKYLDIQTKSRVFSKWRIAFF